LRLDDWEFVHLLGSPSVEEMFHQNVCLFVCLFVSYYYKQFCRFFGALEILTFVYRNFFHVLLKVPPHRPGALPLLKSWWFLLKVPPCLPGALAFVKTLMFLRRLKADTLSRGILHWLVVHLVPGEKGLFDQRLILVEVVEVCNIWPNRNSFWSKIHLKSFFASIFFRC